MRLNTKRIDISQVIDILIVLGFAIFFIKIIRNGSVLNYVHPRIVPYILFAAIYLLLISPFMLKDLKKKIILKIDWTQYIIIGFTLILAFTIPPITLNAENAGNKANFKVSADTNNINNQANSSSNENNTAQKDTCCPPGEVENTDKVIIGDVNFTKTVDDMFENIDKYVGKEIEIFGFVYKDDKMKKDEFVIGRYVMTCCTADAELIGLLCSDEQAGTLKSDEWFNIKGVVVQGSYDDKVVPGVKVLEIKSIPKPAAPYVYP